MSVVINVQVVPSFGSAEGGTQIHIEGINFAAGVSSLESSRLVYIGDEQCKIIEYFTSDSRIVCITPKCYTPACLSSENWLGYDNVALSVYVQTVETILGTSSSFQYNGQYTPFITKMSHATWASSTSYVVGKSATGSPSEISIYLSDQYTDMGDDSELNPSSVYYWATNTQLYYRPPADLAAGFVNLTMTSQDDGIGSPQGTGLARMFPTRHNVNYSNDFTFTYNFDSSLAGTVYSVCLFPSVRSVSPRVGSLGGGTLLTILGSGFTHQLSLMTVYAGGVLCDVISSTFDTLTCKTRAVDQLANPSLNSLLFGQSAVTFQANSSRAFGSPGCWVKMWTYGSANVGKDSYAVQFPWRTGFYFSMYYEFGGSDWPTTASTGMTTLRFVADISTILVAPYSGLYTFYLSGDDVASLYGHLLSTATEDLLASTTYAPGNEFFYFPSQISVAVRLARGQRYALRARTVVAVIFRMLFCSYGCGMNRTIETMEPITLLLPCGSIQT
jgi:hypothetical protein